MSSTPPQPNRGTARRGASSVTVAIAFTGIAMIVSLTLWLVVMSGRSDANPKASRLQAARREH